MTRQSGCNAGGQVFHMNVACITTALIMLGKAVIAYTLPIMFQSTQPKYLRKMQINTSTIISSGILAAGKSPCASCVVRVGTGQAVHTISVSSPTRVQSALKGGSAQQIICKL